MTIGGRDRVNWRNSFQRPTVAEEDHEQCSTQITEDPCHAVIDSLQFQKMD